MKASDLVQVLRELPEYRLRLIELTWKVTRDGSIEPNLLAFHSKEIAEAIAEAEAYRDATREAVRCLIDHFQS